MNEDKAKIAGERFKVAREKLRLTQQDIADKVGLNVSHYAKIERGEVKTSFENYEMINKVLKINSKSLVVSSSSNDPVEKV